MARLGYCSGYAGSSTPEAIELGKRLSTLSYPAINRFFFTSGGGEASETNFKGARSYWKIKGFPNKTKVISRQWGSHGVTLAAMSASGITNYWPCSSQRCPASCETRPGGGLLGQRKPGPPPERFSLPASRNDAS